MKNLILALALTTLSFSAHAAAPATISLACLGTVEEVLGNWDDGFTKTPVNVSIKIAGPALVRFGTSLAYDDIQVNYGTESIAIKNIKKMPEFHLYDLNDAYENLLLTDIKWYQNGQNMDGSRFVTPNTIKIVALPKTMNTTGEGREAQDSNTLSTFTADVTLDLTDGSQKVAYTSHSATGRLNCTYNQVFPKN